MSLPIFPDFKPLDLDDRPDIEIVTSQFLPYSDHNFISLWAWDTEESIQVSKLNENIVFLMLDYLTKEKFYTFAGINKLEKTIDELLVLSGKKSYGNELKLIPKETIDHIPKSNSYKIKADRDNFDYVLHVPAMLNLNTRSNKSYRKRIKLFESLHKAEVTSKLTDVREKAFQTRALDLFDHWATKKINTLPKSEIDTERLAITRLFAAAERYDIQTTAIYIKDKLIGFSTDEILGNKYAMGHFLKADIDYPGAFQYVDHQVNLNLAKKDVEFINIEQDMGLANLRTSKMGLHPYKFLEKFTLSAAS